MKGLGEEQGRFIMTADKTVGKKNILRLIEYLCIAFRPVANIKCYNIILYKKLIPFVTF